MEAILIKSIPFEVLRKRCTMLWGFLNDYIIGITITVALILVVVVLVLGGGDFLAILTGLLVVAAGFKVSKLLEEKELNDTAAMSARMQAAREEKEQAVSRPARREREYIVPRPTQRAKPATSLVDQAQLVEDLKKLSPVRIGGDHRVGMLTDQAMIAEVAQSGGNWGVRLSAVHRLEDQVILGDAVGRGIWLRCI